jgi:HEPN domain-containing protein
MISQATLRTIAEETLADAEILLQHQRWKGAYYLCGYAVEIALKERICQTLGWAGYPDTNKEFEALSSFRTHDLDMLLRLSGVEQKVREALSGPWAGIRDWNPKLRYGAPDEQSADKAQTMLARTKVLLEALWTKIP